MSWLNELKREPEVVKFDLPDHKGAEVPEHLSRVKVQMDLISSFFTDFVAQHETVNPEVKRDYDVCGFARLDRLEQSKYTVSNERLEGVLSKVELKYQCRGKNLQQFWVDTKNECDGAREQLLQHQLQFRWKDDANWRYVFTVQPVVPVRLEFEPQADKNAVKLRITNLERLGVVTYSLDRENITPTLLEELGKRIVGRDHRFDELSGYRVAEDVRQRFKQRIEERQRRREAELNPPPLATPKSPGRFTQLLRKVQPSDAATGTKSRAKAKQKPLGKYTWMVTGCGEVRDTSDFVGRIGPAGARPMPLQKIIAMGKRFRMLDATGRVRYTGYITGECTGREPLEEYGDAHGCARIEYQHKGSWVAV